MHVRFDAILTIVTPNDDEGAGMKMRRGGVLGRGKNNDVVKPACLVYHLCNIVIIFKMPMKV